MAEIDMVRAIVATGRVTKRDVEAFLIAATEAGYMIGLLGF